jgi:predicted RNA-binding protein YlxR (DUF448 family)
VATTPLRTCVGCRSRAAKQHLSRLVWDEGTARVVSDPLQVRPGRGVYLHPECADRALRNRGVGRGLRRPVVAEQVRTVLAEVSAAHVWAKSAPEH